MSINHNLYSYTNYKNIYITLLQDLTIKKYYHFLYNLFNYYKLKPPYIFIKFSKGCYDLMCF